MWPSRPELGSGYRELVARRLICLHVTHRRLWAGASARDHVRLSSSSARRWSGTLLLRTRCWRRCVRRLSDEAENIARATLFVARCMHDIDDLKRVLDCRDRRIHRVLWKSIPTDPSWINLVVNDEPIELIKRGHSTKAF
jgi:hypothetical protein